MRPASVLRASRAALFPILAFVFVGCASDGPRRGAPPPPVVPLQGSVTLLDGRLRADVDFGPMRFAKEDTAEGRGRPGTRLHGNMNVSGHNGDIRGGGGLSYDAGNASIGVGAGGGGMGGGASFGGGRGGGRREGGGPRGERGEGGPRYAAAFGPLAAIHLRFTNTSAAKLAFRVVDFASPLGNFVVQPEVFTLEPGQTAEAEQMSTELGGGVTGVDITVTVKSANGSDKQVLTLRPVERSADAPPPQRD
jgi:hypothetical protein